MEGGLCLGVARGLLQEQQHPISGMAKAGRSPQHTVEQAWSVDQVIRLRELA